MQRRVQFIQGSYRVTADATADALTRRHDCITVRSRRLSAPSLREPSAVSIGATVNDCRVRPEAASFQAVLFPRNNAVAGASVESSVTKTDGSRSLSEQSSGCNLSAACALFFV